MTSALAPVRSSSFVSCRVRQRIYLDRPAGGANDFGMITILWPALITVIGLVIYALTTNPKLSEIGRLMFFAGLLWTVYLLSGSRFDFGRMR